MKKLKQRVIESTLVGKLFVLFQIVIQKSNDNKIVMFPGQLYKGTSGDLRGAALAKELICLGWRVIVVPPWLSIEYRNWLLLRENPTYIYFQQSRHPLNRPNLYPDHKCILDVDDADFLNNPEIVSQCGSESAIVIGGSRFISNYFRQFNRRVKTIWTGTYITDVTRSQPNNEREPIIAWAHSDPLSYLPGAAFIQSVLLELKKEYDFTFHIYGVNDEKKIRLFFSSLLDAGVEIVTYPKMSYTNLIHSLTKACIGLHPIEKNHTFSQGKSFGKLLTYMAADCTIVTSNSVDHPLFFCHEKSAMLVDTAAEWIKSISYLLDNDSCRYAMARSAHKELNNRLTTKKAAKLLDQHLRN